MPLAIVSDSSAADAISVVSLWAAGLAACRSAEGASRALEATATDAIVDFTVGANAITELATVLVTTTAGTGGGGVVVFSVPTGRTHWRIC